MTTAASARTPQLATAFRAAVEEDLKRRLDRAQRDAVLAPAAESLFLVAGPGSGKTTVLALRILRLVLVDGVAPEEILATTFTRRAAEELRSRLLTWGQTLVDGISRRRPH